MTKKKDRKKSSAPDQIPVKVIIKSDTGEQKQFTFVGRFTIGRDASCDVRLDSPGISRRHAEVSFRDGYWWLKDLNSANGIYVMGRRIEEIPLGKNTSAEFGLKDATLIFNVEGLSTPAQTMKEKAPSLTGYIKHYFEEENTGKMGDHTRMIRGAFQKIQKKQRLRFFSLIAGVTVIAIGIGIYSYFQHQEIKKQREIAKQIFYTMKSLELEIAQIQDAAQAEGDSAAEKQVLRYRSRYRELASNYNHFLDELHFYENADWDEQDRAILRVARAFGECELGMPEDFLQEVHSYIRKWRTTDRFENALQRASENKFTEIVAQTMLEYGLPPQFFYLALQESDFDVQTVGPKTRFGIAKGVWQFIPATAVRYGLQTGPLVGLRRYDPRDERADFRKSTRAAARYIRDIYNTEAQASGLLVIASYNWGERKIRELVRQMPENPRERNFWQLLKNYRSEIPRQTYDYVFYIISAAAIGENPKLFGFDLESPLARLEEKLAS